MPFVRIEHAVPDFDKWKLAFDSDPADRKGSGVRTYQISRATDDGNYVVIDLEFDSLSQAEAFVKKMEIIWNGPGKAVMHNPRCRIVDRMLFVEL